MNINIQYVIISYEKGVDKMAYTQAQNRATQKYIKSNYDRFELVAPKGKKAEYKAIAESKGLSLNQYVIGLIEEDIKKGSSL